MGACLVDRSSRGVGLIDRSSAPGIPAKACARGCSISTTTAGERAKQRTSFLLALHAHTPHTTTSHAHTLHTSLPCTGWWRRQRAAGSGSARSSSRGRPSSIPVRVHVRSSGSGRQGRQAAEGARSEGAARTAGSGRRDDTVSTRVGGVGRWGWWVDGVGGSFPIPVEAGPERLDSRAAPCLPNPIAGSSSSSSIGKEMAMADFSRVRKELNECARDQKSGVTAT